MLNVETKNELFRMIDRKKGHESDLDLVRAKREEIFWLEGMEERVKRLDRVYVTVTNKIEDLFGKITAITSELSLEERKALKKEYENR